MKRAAIAIALCMSMSAVAQKPESKPAALPKETQVQIAEMRAEIAKLKLQVAQLQLENARAAAALREDMQAATAGLQREIGLANAALQEAQTQK